MKYARIDLDKTNYQPTIDCRYLSEFTGLPTIYKKYCEYKKFASVMPLFNSQFYESDVLGYYHNNVLVAFSLIKVYDDKNVETVQFAWDYENPELRLGIESLKNECALYKARGFKYLYLGLADKYKEQFDGFEILGPA
jgi:Arginine-tRNA-protein transferase, C terminus